MGNVRRTKLAAALAAALVLLAGAGYGLSRLDAARVRAAQEALARVTEDAAPAVAADYSTEAKAKAKEAEAEAKEAEAEAKEAEAEAEARVKYYAAVREEMKAWGDKGKNGPVVHFLRNISGFSADDLAAMERLAGVKFRDDMKIGEWVEALLDAGKFPGTLDDWRSPDCRMILDPNKVLSLQLVGRWAGAAELAAVSFTEADRPLVDACNYIARNEGLK